MCSLVTFLLSILTLILVGLGVGERFRRFGEALLDRRPPLGEPLRDLRPPLGEGLRVLRPPRPLELERRLLRREAERLLDLKVHQINESNIKLNDQYDCLIKQVTSRY